MPKELALDLASLALYDIVMFVDDSGSMAFEENGERIEDLQLIASKVAEVATLFDDDGILMRFMNSPMEGNGLRWVSGRREGSCCVEPQAGSADALILPGHLGLAGRSIHNMHQSTPEAITLLIWACNLS